MTNTTNKSGFEIRAELLNQAHRMLSENNQREADEIYAHNDSYPNDKKGLKVSPILARDIVVVAKELNEFVTQQ
jgi:hypothetical protein|tara:strand:- start:373 stop:594 length:222 start_codon:yes stop_codon:yes gene_type:complete